jgi:hypothetical protein
MQFITSQEVAQLQQILIHNTHIQSSDADLRSALLTNCGLGKYCGLVQLDKSLFQFVVSLCAKLSDVCITVDSSERLGLVVFLEYISLIDLSLSTNDQHFIHNREPVPCSELKEDILSTAAGENVAETLQSLQRRLPLDRSLNNLNGKQCNF